MARLLSGMASASAWSDQMVARAALSAKTWLLWPPLLAVASGAGLWALSHPNQVPALDTNHLSDPDRRRVLIWVAGAFAALLIAYGAVIVARRIRVGAWLVVDTTSRMNRWLSGLLATPFLAALRLPNIETTTPKFTLFLIACAAAFVGRLAYHVADAPRAAGGEDGASAARSGTYAGVLTAVVLAVMGIGYAIVVARFAILGHYALTTRASDLGVCDSAFYNAAHGRVLSAVRFAAGAHRTAHLSPIIALLSPLYLLHPRAELLLGLQSLWLASGVVPVYLLARTTLDSRAAGLVLAAAYALCPALHAASLVAFEPIAFAAPPLIWAMFLFERGRLGWSAVALAITVACREDMAIVAAIFAIQAIRSHRARAQRFFWITLAVSALYFFVARGLVLGVAIAPWLPGELGAATEPKILLATMTLMALAFLPLLATPGRLLFASGLLAVAIGYARDGAVLVGVAFALAPLALQSIRDGQRTRQLGLDPRRCAPALLAGALTAAALLSWKFGAFVDNAGYRSSFGPITRSLTSDQRAWHTWLEDQIATIPPTASVAATERLGAHASNRRSAFLFPERTDADYLLLDDSELQPADIARYRSEVQRGELTEIARRDKIALLRRADAGAAP